MESGCHFNLTGKEMKIIQKSLVLIILIIPFLEIYLLLAVGGLIGALPAILLVMLTAGLGAALVRQQGFSTWQRLQASLAQGVMPAAELLEGLLLLMGGLLLLTPGFVTDALGLVCLIPASRLWLARTILQQRLFSMAQPGSPFQANQPQGRDILEGEFKKED